MGQHRCIASLIRGERGKASLENVTAVPLSIELGNFPKVHHNSHAGKGHHVASCQRIEVANAGDGQYEDDDCASEQGDGKILFQIVD